VVDFVVLGIILVLLGFVVIIAATILTENPRSEGRSVRGGGVVMIGPIPIIFGSDAKWASVAIALAIVLIALSILITLFGV